MTTSKKPEETPESESASEAQDTGSTTTPDSTPPVGGRLNSVYSSGAGKRVYEITSDPALFLRYGVVGAAILGLAYTLFSVLSVRSFGFSTIMTTLFFSLLVTLVATGVLYALRTIVEQSNTRE